MFNTHANTRDLALQGYKVKTYLPTFDYVSGYPRALVSDHVVGVFLVGSRFLGSFRIAAGTAGCSPGPAPAKQLQVPSVQIRRACGVSYFSEPESVPPSPSLPVPVLPNFIEERRGTPSASDVESDAWTVCSNLANDPRPSVPSIFSDSYPGEHAQCLSKPPV